MLHYNKNSKDISFWSVAGAIILFGAGILAVGLVEWLFSIANVMSFGYPMCKILIGVVIVALGYIILELEMIRKAK